MQGRLWGGAGTSRPAVPWICPAWGWDLGTHFQMWALTLRLTERPAVGAV